MSVKEKNYKFICLGSKACGKTSIIKNYIYDYFNPNVLSVTVGIDFYFKSFIFNNFFFKLHIWDIGGTSINRIHNSISSHIKNIDGIILVFDLTDKKSLLYLNDILCEINNYYDLKNIYNSPSIVLIGTKNDLNNLREISYEDGMNFATKNGIDIYVELSHNDNDKINQLFLDLALRINENKADIYYHHNDNIKKNYCCSLL
jgi:GTPase SAR1 family protein